MTARWEPGGFFVARTPLLPVEVFDRLRADEGLDPAVVGDPIVQEALALAAPAFSAELSRAGVQDGLDPGLHRTLVRYLVRMSTRSTPLGLLAGCSWGRLADGDSRLELVARQDYRRLARLDVRHHAVSADVALAAAPDEDFDQLVVGVNPDVHSAHGYLRLTRLSGAVSAEVPELLEFVLDPPLAVLMDLAESPLRTTELIGALVGQGHAADADEARDYVRAVADAGLLVSEIHPRMTSADNRPARATAGDHLVAPGTRRALNILEDLDGRPLSSPERATPQASWLQDLDADFGPGPVVDLWKPASTAHLDVHEVERLGGTLDLLSRLALSRPHRALEAFTAAFVDRYEEQWELDTLSLARRRGVPLVEALDAETGLAFGGGTNADPAPLIDDLDFPPATDLTGDGFSRAVHSHLLDAVVRHASSGAIVWELGEQDLAVLATADPAAFPDSAAVVVSRGRADDRSLWTIRGVSGPAATGRFARFTGADPELLTAARDFCSREAAQRPEAQIVDFIHQPPGRAANLAVHPSLRPDECPLYGVGAQDRRSVRLADLRLTMRAGTLVLFSSITGREVLPRLPSSYNYEISPFPLVRFLGALQHRRDRRDLGWHWGDLESSPFLPRVEHAGVVLSTARWRLHERDLTDLLGAGSADQQLTEARRLRERRRLPRLVGITHGDLVLPIDLESVTLLEQLVALARSDGELRLTEVFLDDSPTSLVAGPEGRYSHELVIPFLRDTALSSAAVSQVDPSGGAASASPALELGTGELTFVPGSPWLSTEVVCGTSDVDRVLEAVTERLPTWPVSRWFFVRYDQPSWHVRLRFAGEPADLLDVLSDLGPLFAQPQLAGRVRGWSIQTYRPELERYGGVHGLEVCHDVFHTDSTAVARLSGSPWFADATIRWQLALRAVSDLMTALGLSSLDQLHLAQGARDRFRWEHEADAPFIHAVGRQFRQHRELVEEAMSPVWPRDPLVAEVLGERAAGLSLAGARLNRLWSSHRLNRPVTGLAPSLVHMTFNRWLRSEHRAQETVLYDYLGRALHSRRARQE